MRILLLTLVQFCSIAKADTFTHAATNLHFPDALAQWKQTRVTEFPEKILGVEINYLGPGNTIVSFYIYTGGIVAIPTGSENEPVQQEFAKVKKEMDAAMRSRFQDVSAFLESTPEIKTDEKKATLAVAAYQFRDKGHRWLSWVLLTGHKNHFLKLRYTQTFENDSDIETGQQMLKEVAEAFIEKNEDNADAFWQRDAKSREKPH